MVPTSSVYYITLESKRLALGWICVSLDILGEPKGPWSFSKVLFQLGLVLVLNLE